MRYGHKESQSIFQELGQALQYYVKKSYSSSLPTDGVWCIKHPLITTNEVPIVAIEIIVSEGTKSIKGSVRTLEQVSPILAILLIHKGEICSRLLSKGYSEEKAEERVESMLGFLKNEISKSCQRFEIWTEHTLYHWNELHKSSY